MEARSLSITLARLLYRRQAPATSRTGRPWWIRQAASCDCNPIRLASIAGNNAYAPADADLDGNPRISGGTVDIGAYEFQWPQLTITPSAVNVVLTWPTNNAAYDYTGFTLQSTTNLGSSAVWSTNSPAPVVIGGQNVIINPLSGPQQFYRLVVAENRLVNSRLGQD